MAIIIKSNEEIKLMQIAGDVVARTHELIEKYAKAGVTTKELDTIAADYIRSRGAIASFLGYEGAFGAGKYPGSVCLSINEEVIHGIPSLRKLKDGDILSVDIGAYINGYHGDAARTLCIGNVSEEDRKLVEVTKQSFFEGIKMAKEGNHLYEISAAIEAYVVSHGFSIVRDYVGHGVGKNLHEAPEIPNYRVPRRGPKLQRGMVLAIEPMVNIGTWEVEVLDDLWTVVTCDGKKSAHYENTIAITDGEPEILTMVH